jgi:hypothetical protein
MNIRQIRTSIETRGMLEKLRSIYLHEKFKDEQVMMTPGYLLNSAYVETQHIKDWDKVIDCPIKVEDEFISKVKESKTSVIRFRLSEKASNGIDELTRLFSDELGLRVQTGFTAKLIIKAAILLREEKNHESN